MYDLLVYIAMPSHARRVRQIAVYAVVEQEAHNVVVAEPRGFVEHGPAMAALADCWVGAIAEEVAYCAGVAAAGRFVEGRLSVWEDGIDAGPFLEEELRDAGAASDGGFVEWGLAVAVGGFDVGIVLEETVNDVPGGTVASFEKRFRDVAGAVLEEQACYFSNFLRTTAMRIGFPLLPL